MRTLTALVRATHPAPTAVVTALVVLLALRAEQEPVRVLSVAAAVLLGQLTIGWSNDLLDAARDRAVGRTDKPLVTGALSERTVAVALVVALVACLGLTWALGPWAAGAHLLVLLGGWSYNLGVKATVWSWLPYAVAFGALPAVVRFAQEPPLAPPWWMVACGALLGVGAHLANVLPDLADDAATGVRGLPHRMGGRAAAVLAGLVLLAGSAVAVLGPQTPVPAWGWAALVVAGVLAAVCIGRPGKLPFYAAMAIALIDVLALVGRTG